MKNRLSLNTEVSFTEIVFSILIFAAAGIIALNCFAVARYTQIMARDKVQASAIVLSDIEIIKSLKTVEDMYEFLDTSYLEVRDHKVYIKYFDKNWSLNDIDREYKMTMVLSGGETGWGELKNINISIEKTSKYPFIKKDENRLVYSIESKKFFPLGGPMAHKNGSSNISFGIGGTLIVTVFVVLCLMIFSVLAFTTAYSDFKLSVKTQEMTADYYKIHGLAEEKLAQISHVLHQNQGEEKTATIVKSLEGIDGITMAKEGFE